MKSLTLSPGPIHLGMDTSKDAIVVGILRPGEEIPVVDRIFNDEPSIRRLIGRFPDRGALRTCYEAGPGGFELYRLLISMKVACDVVAPALVPKGAADRVKTDRRDAMRLARLHRAGELTPIRVPSPAEEAVRDLVRARADLLADRKRAKQRITSLLMRHGRIWRQGVKWTAVHRQWVQAQRFEEPALSSTYQHYLAALQAREAELAALEKVLLPWAGREPLAGAVHRLIAYRGIAELTALTLASEVVDWRRFPSARAFMGFTGLTPSEYSSGERSRRGHITKAGPADVRTALTEAAWADQFRPAVGAPLRRRQAGASPATVARAWSAQQRLCAKFRQMTGPGKRPSPVAVTAVARELAGFVWAEMTSE
ncbi:IS110 family transposase [Nonomuraea sp. NBC_00507]|uniref:IS110 family transposase n=1 Tax=Nonomuraea sp. NBC_00507 TaxID=2976002 RepID=UPI002E185664